MKRSRQFRVRRPRARRGISAASAVRIKRFAAGIALEEAAKAAHVSLTRASLVERGLVVDAAAAAALDAAITKLSAANAGVRP